MKKILIGLCCAMTAGVMVFNVNVAWQNKEKATALVLENIEALANEEEGFKNPCPYTGGTCILEIGGRYVAYFGYRY